MALRLATLKIYCGIFLYTLHKEMKAKDGHKWFGSQSFLHRKIIFLGIKSRRLLQRVNKVDTVSNSFWLELLMSFHCLWPVYEIMRKIVELSSWRSITVLHLLTSIPLFLSSGLSNSFWEADVKWGMVCHGALERELGLTSLTIMY